ncbi:MAG: CPBP family intramembrane glutamic endopeptidase, partial [Pygmaiobacter sp.]
MKKDKLYYSANLAGLTVLLYLLLALFLRSVLAAVLSLHLPGAALTNPIGVSDIVVQLLNGFCTALNLALPLLVLVRLLPPLGIHLPLRRVPLRVYLLTLPLFLMVTTLCTALASGLRRLLTHGGYLPPTPSELPQNGFAALLCLVATCILPALGEELLFRGALQSLLRPWGDWFAIGTTSLLFCLLHHDLSQLPSIFVISLFLGYIAVVTGSVLPCIVLHCAN